MKKILAISGSRADYGLLEWPVKVLRESFNVQFVQMEPPLSCAGAAFQAHYLLEIHKPDCLLILGDRWEILQAAIAAHLQRVPIAHIAGGDVTLGSYDNAMRDCISRLATYHFPTTLEAQYKLVKFIMPSLETGAVKMIGNIAIDYILHGDWKRERPFTEPYVVVSYQAETIDGTNEIGKVLFELPQMKQIFLIPNMDHGNGTIAKDIKTWCAANTNTVWYCSLPHGEFLNLLFHCEEFIGNSSAMLYEAPELGVKCRMIGKRQQGRVVPTGDGKASERIREVLCRVLS